MKNQKGYTGVDIAISVVVITIFIALIGTLVFNFNSRSKEMEYNSKALDYAIKEIEVSKSKDINDSSLVNVQKTEILDQLSGKGTGYYKEIEVVDISNIISDSDLGDSRTRVSGLVKKVTVTVSYNFRNQTKSVKLSTIVSKEF